MFAVRVKPLYRVCEKLMIRNLRNRRLDVKGPNPGLDNRIKGFKEEGLKIEDEDAEEFIAKSESSFYNVSVCLWMQKVEDMVMVDSIGKDLYPAIDRQVGEAYNEHLNETLMGKYELRHRIIKEKYFKENMPNLLTWSEKEQIRHLATTQPDEWTPEKIAESFPVTVPVVKKLLKYPWKPADEQRIARHDASVMRNWRELKEGSMQISENIRQHFLKYSDRVIPPLNKKSIKIDITQEEKMGEFEQIVKRCAANENTDNSSNYHKKYTEHGKEANGYQYTKKNYKRVTLDVLTDKIKKSIEKGDTVNMPDRIILSTIDTKLDQTSEIASELNNEIDLYKDQENNVAEYKEKDENADSVMDYPERIRIPKKAYKKGATYKVNDCYYDHDGKFLYRVLGMCK